MGKERNKKTNVILPLRRFLLHFRIGMGLPLLRIRRQIACGPIPLGEDRGIAELDIGRFVCFILYRRGRVCERPKSIAVGWERSVSLRRENSAVLMEFTVWIVLQAHTEASREAVWRLQASSAARMGPWNPHRNLQRRFVSAKGSAHCS